MTDEKALTPIEQKTVLFYEDEITAVLVEYENKQQVYIPIKPICDLLGVDWHSQRQRIHRDPVLSEVVMSTVITTSDISSTDRRPHTSKMISLPLDFLNGWLFGINADRVKPDISSRLLRYQRECYRILADAFLPQNLFTESTSSSLALMQIRETALAVARMAEEQLALNARLDKAAIMVGNHEKRIQLLENKLNPGNPITDEQAAEVAQRVKALALTLGEQDPSKNHFQGIFSELYRRFQVTSYKLIPQSKYEAVLAFLAEWQPKV